MPSVKPLISIGQKGDFSKTARYLNNLLHAIKQADLAYYGRKGVEALKFATPVDTGLTADSWKYDISYENGRAEITWSNTNTNEGENIAILIQYGHGTGNGAYVVGVDYINPTLRPIFDEMADSIWKEVTRA